MKDLKKYTTVEIGRMLGVNYTTVNNWIKRGRLKAHQTPGGHRRVMEDDLLDFLHEFNMPVPGELNSRPKVLIVDDEENYLKALSRWLKRFTNYTVLTTDNGMEALLIAGEEKPALILVDILMPGVDGVEVCRALKSRPGTRDIMVLGITGRADRVIREELIQAGALDCLDKTISIEELAEIINRHINHGAKKGHGEDRDIEK